MVEIFSMASGQSGAATRSVSNDIRLTTPSDVYFGSGAAGVAFYEKSGADLKVTLLDGQEVVIRDFFVIGAAGEYSRLRDGGSAGAIEVTGLIAPEPFVPPEATPQTAVAEVEQKAQTTTPSVALRDGETVIDVNVDSGEAAGSAADAGSSGGASPEGAGGPGFFAGIALDRAVFGAAMIPAVAVMLRANNDNNALDTPQVTSDPSPEPSSEADETVAVDQRTTGEDMTTVDPDIADLLTAILDEQATESDLFASESSDAPVALLTDTADGGSLHDSSAGSDLFSALLGDLTYTPPEG
ncbi:hypothetical protein HOY34_19030 [Xinfangfangia sp. D13-10-4-6]|uniref:BapA/Bap/LapF family prefix-like domain-containing protein n=1 Tax=Pseudogemmobacter hezensis TaxID=2737662 RepID=UPI0015581C88|nr:hypothetical protein [Pseudogemmobacter hezensis]NPD17285.1 hypothetical protein [Pseudogemmobacter hezensis]